MFENRKTTINLQNLVIFASLCVVLIAWLGSLLAILGAFKLIIPILLIIAGSFCVLALILKIKLEFNISRNEIILIFSVILLATANGYFYHETIDHGRDHGAYISSAINIAKTGYFEAKEEYMHTYPSYWIRSGKIISMPYPAYASILAVIYSFFGINGIFWGNAIFFLLFLLIMYLIGIEFGSKKIGLIFIALFSTHYLTIWFTRRTNNETFFMLILWLGVYLILKGYTSKKKYYLYLSLIPLSIIPLVRLEGFLYYLSFTLALLFLFLQKRETAIKNIVLAFAVLIFLSIPFLTADFTRQTIFDSLPLLKSQTQQAVAITTESGTFGEIFNNNIHRFVFDMFTYYLLTPLFIIFVIYLIKHRHNSLLILVLILISPAYYFLINPSNSPDQPWFMRRFWPHIIVILYFVSSMIIGNMELKGSRKKLMFVVILALLLFSNLIYSSKIITFSENKGAVEQLNNLNKQLPEDAYIFGIENRADRFLIPMYFLFDRPIINNGIEQENRRMITIEELTRYIPEDKELIVISPRKDIPKLWISNYFNDFDLEYMYNYTIKVPQLNLAFDILGYQGRVPSDIQEGRKITYEWIEEKSRGIPPTNISLYTLELFIFKVNKNSKPDLYRKNISLIEGWERKGDDLICSANECSFKSLIWDNSLILNISYLGNSTGNLSFFNNIEKSKTSIPLKNHSISILISPEKNENRLVVNKGILIRNISIRYAKDAGT